MSNESAFSLQNKWSCGETTWGRLPLPEYALRQACVLPVQSMLDPHVGTETILCVIDPTDFIQELAVVTPFQLFVSIGLIRTDYGPVVFVLYHVPNPDSPEPFVILEQTLNPFDAKILAPYYDLARQSHWHVFLVDGAGNEVNWFEFVNNFGIGEALDAIAGATEGMSCTDFMKAKEQYSSMYTIDDLFQMTRGPEGKR